MHFGEGSKNPERESSICSRSCYVDGIKVVKEMMRGQDKKM